MAKTRLGFDLGSSSMKVALLRDNSLVRLEKVRLPENLVDERGTIALPHMFTQFLKQTKKELSGAVASAQSGDLPAGHHAEYDRRAAYDEPALRVFRLYPGRGGPVFLRLRPLPACRGGGA